MAAKIEASDILDMAAYETVRKERRAGVVAAKRHRRVAVGPFAMFYFENRLTLLHQIHEMLRIEKGGPAQIADELAAYNPLVPNGSELVATVMFEMDDPVVRKRSLSRLGGIEDTAFFRFGGLEVTGRPETDLDRTTADGKASAVQFIHFPFTPPQIAAFRSDTGDAMLGFTHPAYGHMAVVPSQVRQALAADFDPQ